MVKSEGERERTQKGSLNESKSEYPGGGLLKWMAADLGFFPRSCLQFVLDC